MSDEGSITPDEPDDTGPDPDEFVEDEAHVRVTYDTLYDYLADTRNVYEVAHPGCDEEDVPLVRTEQICDDLGIDVPTFHNLKTRLWRALAPGEITMVGRALPGSGGWGWKIVGNPGDATSRIFSIARQKNIVGRLTSSYAVSQTFAAYAASGAMLVPGDQIASDALRRRVDQQEYQMRFLLEGAERLLADLAT